jgi:hypothetical protein
MCKNLVNEIIIPRKEGCSVVKMKGRYIQRVGAILQMVQLKNRQTYCNNTIALLIVIIEKGEDINWTRVFFHGLKLDMKKWLLGGPKPPIMYVAHVVDMLI